MSIVHIILVTAYLSFRILLLWRIHYREQNQITCSSSKIKKTHFISHAYLLSVCCAHLYSPPRLHVGLPRWLSGLKKKKNPPVNAGNARDMSSIPGSGRSPGGGNCNLLQCSCLENSMDRAAWWITVHGVTESQTWLTDWAHTHIFMLQTQLQEVSPINGPCALLLCLQHLFHTL